MNGREKRICNNLCNLVGVSYFFVFAIAFEIFFHRDVCMLSLLRF